MGLSQEQWQALLPSQQAEFRPSNTPLNGERQQQETRQLEKERFAQEQAMAKAEQTRQAYASARTGTW